MTPSLSAIFLGHHRERAQFRFFRWFNEMVAASTGLYRRGVSRLLNLRVVALVVFLALLGATYFVYQRVPRTFLPEDDRGYLIFVVQAPQGASLSYTRDICAKADQLIERHPEVGGAFTTVGQGTAGNAPTRPSCTRASSRSKNARATFTRRPR